MRFIRQPPYLLFVLIGVGIRLVSLLRLIGFCGLVVPHIVRRLHGGSHRKILIPAALAGAVFLMLADILGRVVSPVRELPVGMVTAAVGCPVFLWLLNRSRAGS